MWPLGVPVTYIHLMQGMGIVSDQEIVQMVGTEDKIMAMFSASLEECHQAKVYTQEQASG